MDYRRMQVNTGKLVSGYGNHPDEEGQSEKPREDEFGTHVEKRKPTGLAEPLATEMRGKSNQTWLLSFGLNTWANGGPINKKRKGSGRSSLGEKSIQEFCFAHTKFEMFVRHPRGKVM